jgi:hypothetical protein
VPSDALRERAWHLIWERLLQPVPEDPETDKEQDSSQPDEELTE